jgi:zinc transporter ZupT
MPLRDGKDGDPSEGERALGRRWPWLLPLAAGVFLGVAALEMLPDAAAVTGAQVWLWAFLGLALFVSARSGLDYIGQHGLAWMATLGIWLHAGLEGAVAAISFGAGLFVGLLVSTALVLHLFPEVAAVVALLTAAGLSLRQALMRSAVSWAFTVGGFFLVFLFLPSLPDAMLGAALALGGGIFLCLSYFTFAERQWTLAPSLLVSTIGFALVGIVRLLFS